MLKNIILITTFLLIIPAKTALAFQITEIMPNPTENQEWIEIYNPHQTWKSLKNWTIADKSKSYTFKQDVLIRPRGYCILRQKTSKLNLNNSSETILLKDQNNLIRQKIEYKKPPKNQSYSLMDGKWLWHKATPGQTNYRGTDLDESKPPPAIQINEILAYTEKGTPELIELYNPSSIQIDLSSWLISDRKSKYTLPPETYLNPFSYLIISQKDSKLSLNNQAETITLSSPDGKTVDWISYKNAQKNLTYSRIPNGEWLWTSPTLGQKNSALTNFKGVVIATDELSLELDQHPDLRFLKNSRFNSNQNHYLEIMAVKIHPYLWQIESVVKSQPITPAVKQNTFKKNASLILLMAGLVTLAGMNVKRPEAE